MVTIKVEEGWIVAVVEVHSGRVLRRANGSKDYCVEHINASLNGLHKYYAENMATQLRNRGELSDL